jgi:hypothetical protein
MQQVKNELPSPARPDGLAIDDRPSDEPSLIYSIASVLQVRHTVISLAHPPATGNSNIGYC